MQVACSQCAASYEFDSAAIPAAGYDAQCTNCGGVFFVKPEVPVDVQVSVSCKACSAVYQFPSSAIPPEGYDAQCTQCNEVFFVSVSGADAAPAVPVAPVTEPDVAPAPPQPEPAAAAAAAAVPPQPEPAPAVQPSAAPVAEEPVVLGSPKPAEPSLASPKPNEPSLPSPKPNEPSQPSPVPNEPSLPSPVPNEPSQPSPVPYEPSQPSPVPNEPSQPSPVPNEPSQPSPAPAVPDPTPAVASASLEPDPTPLGEPTVSGTGDLLTLSMELGEPSDAPDGASLEGDFEQIMARKRKRHLIVGAVVGFIAAYSVITYLAVPRLFDMTVGKIVGVKLTVHPDAIPFVDRGLERLYADTDSAYRDAIDQFTAALEVDAKYPDAIVLAGLAHVFRGSDVQARGREIYDTGAKALAEYKALEKLPRNKRPPDAEERIKSLRIQATKSSNESSKYFEEGGKEVSAGFSQLRDAIGDYQHVPLVVEASGIYYTTDRDSIRKAQDRLRYSIETRFGADSKLDFDNPPNIWAPLLSGLVSAQDESRADEAQAAFESVLKKEPRFQRARFELVQLFDRTGKKDAAQKLAREILSAVPGHGKAKRYLARSAEPTHGGEPTPPDKAPPPGKGKKRKGKRRR